MQFLGRRTLPFAYRHARLLVGQSYRRFGSQDNEGGRLVPYVVLGLPRHATLPQIRARYLELVRKVHPDGGDPGASAQAMAEVSNAYHALTGRVNDGTASDSRISAMMSGVDDVAELNGDGIHQVYAVTVLLDELLDIGGDSSPVSGPTSGNVSCSASGSSGSGSGSSDSTHASSTSSARSTSDNNNNNISDGSSSTTSTAVAGSGLLGGVPVRAHASTLDSVADLKRSLEAQWGGVWGLSQRRRTSEKLAVGWEVVHGNTVLGDWFFLGDYGVKSGDILHVVVRNE